MDYFQKQSCLNKSCTVMRIPLYHMKTISSQTLRKGRFILQNIRLFLAPQPSSTRHGAGLFSKVVM